MGTALALTECIMILILIRQLLLGVRLLSCSNVIYLLLVRELLLETEPLISLSIITPVLMRCCCMMDQTSLESEYDLR